MTALAIIAGLGWGGTIGFGWWFWDERQDRQYYETRSDRLADELMQHRPQAVFATRTIKVSPLGTASVTVETPGLTTGSSTFTAKYSAGCPGCAEEASSDE